MELLANLIYVALHLDQYLPILIQQYGVWIYIAVFVSIFGETGFVVTPFFPGDSLLFVVGTLAAAGGEQGFNIYGLISILWLAATFGNTVNYHVGRFLGPKVFQWENSRFFNRESLEKTRVFYVEHGGKALIISRFLPVIRSFAPFVAGASAMNYARFTFFNVAGSLVWVLSFTLGGYFFGTFPWVQRNLFWVILGLIGITLTPAVIGWLRQKKDSHT